MHLLLCPAIPRPELCIVATARVRAGARVVVASPDWGLTTFMFLRRRSTLGHQLRVARTMDNKQQEQCLHLLFILRVSIDQGVFSNFYQAEG